MTTGPQHVKAIGLHGSIGKDFRPMGPKASCDFKTSSMDFWEGEIAEMLSAATSSHLSVISPLASVKSSEVNISWEPHASYNWPDETTSFHVEGLRSALSHMSMSRNGSDGGSTQSYEEDWFSRGSGSPDSARHVPLSPEFLPPMAPSWDGEAEVRGPVLPTDMDLNWSVLSPSLSARAGVFLPMPSITDVETGFIMPLSDSEYNSTHKPPSGHNNLPPERERHHHQTLGMQVDTSTRQSRGRGRRGRSPTRSSTTSSSDDSLTVTTKSASGSGGRGRDSAERAEESMGVAWREFLKELKDRERVSFGHAREYARDSISWMPAETHGKVLLELADLSKRENNLSDARAIFQLVNDVYPHVHQGWLDYAKMEEECGELLECRRILTTGVKRCPGTENLLIKCLKLLERLGDLKQARALLAHARVELGDVEKGWRLVLEGAMMEARAGNTETARLVLGFLLREVPWHGPIFTEAIKLEEGSELYDKALPICKAGLKAIPRHAPLWFSAMRLHERAGELDCARQHVVEAISSVSRELVWKVFFEAGQMEARAGEWALARGAFYQSANHCPSNLQWKVWVGSARSELAAGCIEASRMLLARALGQAPAKMRSTVMIERGRLEEYAGNIAEAREVLATARRGLGGEDSDWKSYLESVQLEVRAGNRLGAIQLAKESLTRHSGTGRLWALNIQLSQTDEEKLETFRRAYRAVPKSGEVWCEGARMCMDPSSSLFNLSAAREHLGFAVRFTPQYGDTFIELLRLEMLERGNGCFDYEAIERMCMNSEPNYGQKWFACKSAQLDGTRQILRTARARLVRDLEERSNEYQAAIIAAMQNLKVVVGQGRATQDQVAQGDCVEDHAVDVEEGGEEEEEEIEVEGGEEEGEEGEEDDESSMDVDVDVDFDFFGGADSLDLTSGEAMREWWDTCGRGGKARFTAIFGPDPLVV